MKFNICTSKRKSPPEKRVILMLTEKNVVVVENNGCLFGVLKGLSDQIESEWSTKGKGVFRISQDLLGKVSPEFIAVLSSFPLRDAPI